MNCRKDLRAEEEDLLLCSLPLAKRERRETGQWESETGAQEGAPWAGAGPRF
jgi:hypothetical protein